MNAATYTIIVIFGSCAIVMFRIAAILFNEESIVKIVMSAIRGINTSAKM
jgi:hypothetical protein